MLCMAQDGMGPLTSAGLSLQVRSQRAARAWSTRGGIACAPFAGTETKPIAQKASPGCGRRPGQVNRTMLVRRAWVRRRPRGTSQKRFGHGTTVVGAQPVSVCDTGVCGVCVCVCVCVYSTCFSPLPG